MARIAGINIAPNKHAEIALTGIYGIGRVTARKICADSGVKPDAKIKDLTEAEVESIRTEVGKYTIEGDLRRTISMNIRRLMDLGSYRGLRHRLLGRECEIETRIMNLRPHPRNYLGNRWEERHKMINQLTTALVRIENHHRRIAVDYDKRMQALHDRLLRLLNMRDQLYLHDGHSEDTP